MSTVRVRAGSGEDRAAICELLARASLPVEDLQQDTAVRFWVAEDGHRLVGAVGLEACGSAALLRSLVVAPEARRRGLGTRLVAALESEARAAGIRQLVLLTQTARGLFERLGYSVTGRDQVPAPVQASTEFRSLCPASAVCMSKSLTSDEHASAT